MDEKPAQIIIKEVSQSYGALSVIFGFIGIFILSPLFSPIALIFGIISITKKDYLAGIIGITFAIIGVLTSPNGTNLYAHCNLYKAWHNTLN